MTRFWACGLALGLVILWAVAVASQPPAGKDRGEGPPRGGPDRPPPRFELGRVLPPFARDQLELTKDQEEEVAKIEKDVKERLSKILTAEQKKKVDDYRPPRPAAPPPE